MNKALWMCVIVIVVLSVLVGLGIKAVDYNYNRGFAKGYKEVYNVVDCWVDISQRNPIVLKREKDGSIRPSLIREPKFSVYDFSSGTTDIGKGKDI